MRDQRWPGALPEAPRAFEDAIRAGYEDILRFQRRRRIRLAAVACAALAALMGGLMLSNRQPRPDLLAAATPTAASTAVPEEASETASAGFEAAPGEYLRVTGGDMDVGGAPCAAFYAQASEASSRVPLRRYALVYCLGEAGDGFVQVRCADHTGYMRREDLSAADVPVTMYVRSRPVDVPVYAEVSLGAVVASMEMLPGGADVRCLGVPWESVHVPQGENALFAWAEVEWGEDGQRGYVSAADLTHIPPDGKLWLERAVLWIPDAEGALHADLRAGEESGHPLTTLQNLIAGMGPGDVEGVDVGALLELTLRNGRVLRFGVPLEGRCVLIGENGAVYDLGEAGSEQFWHIFSNAEAELEPLLTE